MIIIPQETRKQRKSKPKTLQDQQNSCQSPAFFSFLSSPLSSWFHKESIRTTFLKRRRQRGKIALSHCLKHTHTLTPKLVCKKLWEWVEWDTATSKVFRLESSPTILPVLWNDKEKKVEWDARFKNCCSGPTKQWALLPLSFPTPVLI